jgi:murein DD-endopeptidase MepM/ murein hydrolase activator NlpD
MRIILILSLVVAAMAFAPVPANAVTSLEGSWRGSGIVKYKGGADKMRCRVHFSRAGATSFGVSSDCATETGRYAASGRVVASGSNRYFGLVQGEGVTGKVVIVQHGRSLSVSVTSRRGSAKLSLSR